MKFPGNISRTIQLTMSLLSSTLYLVRQGINLYRVCCPNEESTVDDNIEMAASEIKETVENLRPAINELVEVTANDDHLSMDDKKKILERLLALKFKSISRIEDIPDKK